MRGWRWSVLLLTLAVLLACAPAWAAATRLTLLSSAAQTATANGAMFTVPNIKELVACVDLTAASGTTPALSVWLQTSPDGGTTWYDLAPDVALLDADGTLADQTPTGYPGAAKRNLLTCPTVCAAPKKACAQYTVFGDSIRVRWGIAGTTPSFTFSVRGVGK